METSNRIRKLIKEQFDLKPGEVIDSAELRQDLGLDSLDLLELVMTLEEEFDVDIPDEEAEKLETVIAVINYVEAKLLKKGAQ